MNGKIISIGGSLVGLAVGSVGGYLFAKKKLQADIDEASEILAESIQTTDDCLNTIEKLKEQIQELQSDAETDRVQNRDYIDRISADNEFLARSLKKGLFATPESAVEHLHPSETNDPAELKGQKFRADVNKMQVKTKNSRRVAPLQFTPEEAHPEEDYEEIYGSEPGVEDREEGGVLPTLSKRVPGARLTDTSEFVELNGMAYRRREFTAEEIAAIKEDADAVKAIVARKGYSPEQMENKVFENPQIPGGDEMETDPNAPYIISKEVFYQNEVGHNQTSLQYYAGDDVLAEQDEAINDIQSVVGLENLRFGELSEDRNIVYVRNRMTGMDYDIALSQGKFSVEVLGNEDPDHPAVRGHRKKR